MFQQRLKQLPVYNKMTFFIYIYKKEQIIFSQCHKLRLTMPKYLEKAPIGGQKTASSAALCLLDLSVCRSGKKVAR